MPPKHLFVLGERLTQAFRISAAAIGVLFLIGLVIGYRFSLQGGKAMTASDVAFNKGEFDEAIFQAELAARLYFPGAEHFKQAELRLVTVARGAEAEGNEELALHAWRSLKALDHQTYYWGRGSIEFAELAHRSLERLQAKERRIGEIAPLWKTKAADEDHHLLKGPQSER